MTVTFYIRLLYDIEKKRSICLFIQSSSSSSSVNVSSCIDLCNNSDL